MTRMNPEHEEPKLFTLGIYPKCPFYKPVAVSIILVLISLGTWGITYLNLWAAVGYLAFSILFYFLLMPFTLCRYCYFRGTEMTVDGQQGRATRKLLTVDQWRESGLDKHVGQKHWTYLMSIVWLLPIPLTITSFFTNFSPFAILALIGFVAVLVGNYFYMIRVKCPTCPIREECHSSF
jgi:hypothetical protein